MKHYSDAKYYLQSKYDSNTFRMGPLLECNGEIYYLIEDALWHLKQTGNKEDPIRIEIEQIFSFDYKYNRDEKE
jgi:hypothetical protein